MRGGQWIIESLDAVAAGGRILAQAQSVPTASNPPKGIEAPALAWDARATLQRVNPAAADSRLAAASLNGQLTARIARQAWTFDADLTGAPLQGGPPGASAIRQRLKALRAQGRWEGGTLTLPALLLQTDDTQLQGSLTFHPRAPQRRRPAEPEPARRHGHPGGPDQRIPGRWRAGRAGHRRKPGRTLAGPVGRACPRNGRRAPYGDPPP
jgi:hypothetical protein